MRHKPRKWDATPDDDPLAGLVNLFDLWMVFSIALLLALVAASRLTDASRSAQASGPQAPAEDAANKLEHFRASRDKLTGEGQRLGTAYRLKNGEVVYVPD